MSKEEMDISIFPGTEDEPEFEIKDSKPVLSTPLLAERRSNLKDTPSSLANLYYTVSDGVLWRIFEASTKTHAAHARSERRVSHYRDSLYVLSVLTGLTTLALISVLIDVSRHENDVPWRYKWPPLMMLGIWFLVALTTRYYSTEQRRYEAFAGQWSRLRDSCESTLSDVEYAAIALRQRMPDAIAERAREAADTAGGKMMEASARVLAVADQKGTDPNQDEDARTSARKAEEVAMANWRKATKDAEVKKKKAADLKAAVNNRTNADKQKQKAADKARADALAAADPARAPAVVLEIPNSIKKLKTAAGDFAEEVAKVRLQRIIKQLERHSAGDDADLYEETSETITLKDIKTPIENLKPLLPQAPAIPPPTPPQPDASLEVKADVPVELGPLDGGYVLSSKELWKRIGKILKAKLACDAVENGVTDQDDFSYVKRVMEDDGSTEVPVWESRRKKQAQVAVSGFEPLWETERVAQPKSAAEGSATEKMVVMRRKRYLLEVCPQVQSSITRGDQDIKHAISGAALTRVSRGDWIDGQLTGLHRDEPHKCCDWYWVFGPIWEFLCFVLPIAWFCYMMKDFLCPVRDPENQPFVPPDETYDDLRVWCGCGSGFVCGVSMCRDSRSAETRWRPLLEDTDTVWLLRSNARHASRAFLREQHNLEKLKWISTIASLAGLVAAATLIVPSIWEDEISGDAQYAYIAPLVACCLVLIGIGYISIARRANRNAVAGKAFLELFIRSDALYYQMIGEYANPNLSIADLEKKIDELKALKRFIIHSFVRSLPPPRHIQSEKDMAKHWSKFVKESIGDVQRVTQFWRLSDADTPADGDKKFQIPDFNADKWNPVPPAPDPSRCNDEFLARWFDWCPVCAECCPGCCGSQIEYRAIGDVDFDKVKRDRDTRAELERKEREEKQREQKEREQKEREQKERERKEREAKEREAKLKAAAEAKQKELDEQERKRQGNVIVTSAGAVGGNANLSRPLMSAQAPSPANSASISINSPTPAVRAAPPASAAPIPTTAAQRS